MTYKNAAIYLLYLSTPLLFLAATCNPFQDISDYENQTKRIEIKKGPCFGQCPVYNLSIYDNRVAVFTGERFTDKMGVHVKQLTQKDYEKLLSAFNKTNVWQFQDAYKSEVPDFPTVTITFYDKERSKTVIGKENRPEAVLELEEMLDEIANSNDWKVTDKSTNSEEGQGILVELRKEIDINTWIQKYAKQSMQIKRKVSATKNFWLVTFDTGAVVPEQMLEFIRRDKDVVGAEMKTEDF
ncbi:MAG: hypothetical protein GY705_31570 [Bacteroidetes bacterium]|nr:hypothetical protein [Bacteroidota bacterium]